MNKKYVFTFLLVFFIMCSFLVMFFYFNLIFLIIICTIIMICSIVYLIRSFSEDKDDSDYNKEYDLEKIIKSKDDKFALDTFYLYVKAIIKLICKSYSMENTKILDRFVDKDYISIINNNIKKYKEKGYVRNINSIKFIDVQLDNYYINKKREYYEVLITLVKAECFHKDNIVVSSDTTNCKIIKYKCLLSKRKDNKEDLKQCPICDGVYMNHGKCIDCGFLVNNMYGYYLEKLEELE